MTTNAYMAGRKKYQRPQGMIWSENSGTLEDGIYRPRGYEIGAIVPEDTDPLLIDQFLILSDDNRSSFDFSSERIETRERMINGRMRSYHIADKLSISFSWDMLPSRGFAGPPNFIVTDENEGLVGKPELVTSGIADGLVENKKTLISASATKLQYTSDGGAGGVEILDWYENHPGPFWVYLSYDKYSTFGKEEAAFNNLNKYSQVMEMYFSNFNYSVVKRGGTNYDFWNISVTLEEV
jgi:hypothetical protein